MTTEWWLLDGAMLRGSKLLDAVAASGSSVQLYRDLGAEAGAIGPWVIDGSFSIDVELLPLPMRLGISRWAVDGGIDDLRQHANAIRHMRTADGQVFYLRYADTRVLDAVKKALPPGMQATIRGPLLQWTWLDRQMQPALFAPLDDKHTTTQALKLTIAQFDSLLTAGLADRLALMLEELKDAALGDVQQPQTFSLIRAAADFLVDRSIESFSLQRAVARQAIVTRGAALDSPGFRSAMAAVVDGTASPAEIEAWVPSEVRMIKAIKG